LERGDDAVVRHCVDRALTVQQLHELRRDWVRLGFGCWQALVRLCDENGVVVGDDIGVAMAMRSLSIVQDEFRLTPRDVAVFFVPDRQPHMTSVAHGSPLRKFAKPCVVVVRHENQSVRLPLG
jgi:hypothetical protein